MKNLFLALICISLIAACKVNDPFVDRVVSPVLVVFRGATGAASNGLTTDPTISSPAAADAKFSVMLYELDKKGILDNAVGIDSLPVSGSAIKLKIRNGKELRTITTNATGIAEVTMPWSEIGVAAGGSASLAISGAHKGINYTKYFRLTASR